MAINKDSRIGGLYEALGIVRIERLGQVSIRRDAKKKGHVDIVEECEYAEGILERIEELIRGEIKKERTDGKK